MEKLQPLSRFSIPLFPYKFKFVGFGFILLGLVSGYLYYFGGKPAFFVTPVFAVITSYLETRFFVLAQTNLLDEFAAVFTVCGFAFIAFSKEKTENESLIILRLKAFFYAAYFTLILWVFLILVIFGWPIFIFSSFLFLVFIIAYLFAFRIMHFRKIQRINRS